MNLSLRERKQHLLPGTTTPVSKQSQPLSSRKKFLRSHTVSLPLPTKKSEAVVESTMTVEDKLLRRIQSMPEAEKQDLAFNCALKYSKNCSLFRREDRVGLPEKRKLRVAVKSGTSYSLPPINMTQRNQKSGKASSLTDRKLNSDTVSPSLGHEQGPIPSCPTKQYSDNLESNSGSQKVSRPWSSFKSGHKGGAFGLKLRLTSHERLPALSSYR